MTEWKREGCPGIANCEACGARNVTYRFPIRNRVSNSRLLICRICRDSFFPKRDAPSIFDEVPKVMNYWHNNQTTGQWPIHVDI